MAILSITASDNFLRANVTKEDLNACIDTPPTPIIASTIIILERERERERERKRERERGGKIISKAC